MNTVSGERPLSTVLQDIVRNTQDIIRSEVRLAKTELTDEIAKAREAATLATLKENVEWANNSPNRNTY